MRRRTGPPPAALDLRVQVSRWHQRLAVALDETLEELEPGRERLRVVVTAYLDVQRATAVRPDAGELFLSVLEQDLAALGAVAPRRAALDLLDELEATTVLEDAAGKVLKKERATLLGPPVLPGTTAPRRRRIVAWSCPLSASVA